MFFRGLLSTGFLAIVLSALFVQAAPVQDTKRQIGDLQCNLNRLEIVGDIAKLQGTMNTLAKQTASDPTNSAFISSAQSGISTAKSAIGNIALAILTGQQAPASDRDAVESGLNQVLSGLNNVTSTDSSVTSNVATALSQLQSASAAGDGVLADCN